MTPAGRRAAWHALQQAHAALQQGDKAAARAWARRAARLAPQWDAPWVLLGLLSPSPRARRAYLERALRLNPGNALARQRLRQLLGEAQTQPTRPVQARPKPATRPRPKPAARPRPKPVARPRPKPAARPRPKPATRPRPKPVARPRPKPAARPRPKPTARWSYRRRARRGWAMMAVLSLAALVWVGFMGWTLRGARPVAAEPVPPNPAATASPTPWQPHPPTATPTPTPTATPTATPSPTPTPSATPTATPTPTATATPTPAPPAPRPPGVAPGERWILVDLSEQRLYAIDGDRLERTFVVSTGLPQTPTVVGTFRIWVKLRSTDMAGPGYYLPNVPYTMYFYQGYGIHGTYWHNNFGRPMSHGCVNMRTEDARWLFHWADVGTVVQIVP